MMGRCLSIFVTKGTSLGCEAVWTMARYRRLPSAKVGQLGLRKDLHRRHLNIPSSSRLQIERSLTRLNDDNCPALAMFPNKNTSKPRPKSQLVGPVLL